MAGALPNSNKAFLSKIFVNNNLWLVIKPGSNHRCFVVALPYDW